MLNNLRYIFRSNRVALDYNAAFQSAIAALQYLELFPPITTTQSAPIQNSTATDGYVDETTESLNDEINLENLDEALAEYDEVTSPASVEAATLPVPKGRLVVEGEESDTQPTFVAATTPELTTESASTFPTTSVTAEATTFTTTIHTTTYEESTDTSQISTTQNMSQNFATDRVFSSSVDDETIWDTTTFTPNSTTKQPVVIRLTSPHQRLSYLSEVVFGEFSSISFKLC